MARRCLRVAFMAVAMGCAANLFADKSVDSSLSADLQKEVKLASATAGTKPKLSIKKGDYELTVDGSLKIEDYYEYDAYMLNKHIPDECGYFKETLDLNFDFAFGEEKYGYDAVEAYLGIRHKGVWGKALSYADRDSGTSGSASVKLDEASFSPHNHYTSKSVLWLREGWIKFALNPIFGAKGSNYVQYLQLGWFPFQLGRGIALGNLYSVNKEFLALYNYAGEDKSAPGIDLFGEIVKDTLWYDLYYAKLEERSKALSDVINPVRGYYQGRKKTPWRGVDKDNDLVAARLQWTAVNNDKVGKLEVEPYVSCNYASDQRIGGKFDPDTNTRLGAYGLGLEHTFQDFEIGGEVAFNFGAEYVKSIDRNLAEIGRIYKTDSTLSEFYTHINKDGTPALVTAESKKAASVDFVYGKVNVNGEPIPGYPEYINNANRFRPAYKNSFDGWMSVLDAAYNLRKWNLKLALSWSYASGDVNPHIVEKNKKYHGFVGLHEGYYGKRVPSIFLLDMRLLKRPLALPASMPDRKINAATDISFTDLQMYGFGLTWNPAYSQNRTVSINPNVIGFWVTKTSHKIDYNGNVAVISPNMARDFMGTELNLVLKSEVLKDLTLFGKFAVFCPGGYFEDIKGIPLDRDFYYRMAETLTEDFDPRLYRLGADTAYHMDIGLEFKF